jgi:hypothetical protein
MKYVLLSAILLVSVHLHGQEKQRSESQQVAAILPNCPSSTKLILEDAARNTRAPRSLGEIPAALSLQSAFFQKPPHVINRAFALFTFYQFAASIADVESTVHGLSHGASEANPLVGSHPSRAKLYQTALPVSVGVAVWSYALKKKGPHSRNWMIPPAVCGSGHIAAVIHNLAGH